MGLLSGLRKFNNTVQKIDDTKDSLKRNLDKKQWSDEDRRCNRNGKIFCWLMILAQVAVAFGVYFLLGIIFSDLFLGGLIGIIVLGAVDSWLVKKAHNYVDDNCCGIAVLLADKLMFAAMILAVAGALLLRIFLVGSLVG